MATEMQGRFSRHAQAFQMRCVELGDAIRQDADAEVATVELDDRFE